ncbi:MAG: hypothetical protein L3K19_03305 [Thermoplasmata archaeon]|nr:hypothetical protein [Thermoplasmata archaeon]
MTPHFRPSRRLLRYPRARTLLDSVERVGAAFPELDGREIRVDLLDPRRRLAGLAYPARATPSILLSPRGLGTPSFEATVAHELTHLLQWPDRILPQGERAVDLFVLARFGTRFVGPPSYLSVPASARSDWPRWAPVAERLAVEATVARSRGTRTYLKQWEERFGAEVASAPRRGSPEVSPPRSTPFKSPLDANPGRYHR